MWTSQNKVKEDTGYAAVDAASYVQSTPVMFFFQTPPSAHVRGLLSDFADP